MLGMNVILILVLILMRSLRSKVFLAEEVGWDGMFLCLCSLIFIYICVYVLFGVCYGFW